jgi:hypothetical protein
MFLTCDINSNLRKAWKFDAKRYSPYKLTSIIGFNLFSTISPLNQFSFAYLLPTKSAFIPKSSSS